MSGCEFPEIWNCGYDPANATCPSGLRPPVSPPPSAPKALTVAEAKFTVGSAVVATASDNFRMLGFNFDFWPSTKDKWGRCGALNSDLTSDPNLNYLAGRLSGSLLRMGGSPADFLLYDTFPGACSEANLNRTQPAHKVRK